MESKKTKPSRRIACLWIYRLTSNESLEIQALAEACSRFTPKIALRGQEAIFLDISGCAGLFSEQGLFLRVQSLARRFALDVRMGIAEDAPTALAVARYSNRTVKNFTRHLLPLEALFDYSSPFIQPSHQDKERVQRVLKIIELSRKLGLKNVGDFLALPVLSLASRFGREGVEIRARLEGRLEAAWPGFQIPEQIIESEDLEEMVGLEPLLFILKQLVDRTMARLRGLGQRASVIRVEFKLEPWSILQERIRSWKISFPLSQGSSVGVMPILQEKLNFDLGREPLGAPVQRIRFEVLEKIPGRSSQRDFFHQKEEDLEKWGALLSRLACKLGSENVFYAQAVDCYLPERSWARTLEGRSLETKTFTLKASQTPVFRLAASLSQDAEIPPALRPARILKEPEFLRLSGSYVICSNGKRWKTSNWMGPERISGEWWRDAGLCGFERDYYRVTTESGEELWIFLDLQSDPPDFYLQGYFD
jgi:protein ImuB